MIEITIQRPQASDDTPDDEILKRWALTALRTGGAAVSGEVVLRLVDAAESRALNARYRGKDAPTNVLSFPADSLPGIADAPLGDIVLCVPQVVAEAAAQGKRLEAHWAHLVMHGCLHLLGHDHQQPDEAEQMEALERRLLAEHAFPDPYRELTAHG